jgi:hypothetical protein
MNVKIGTVAAQFLFGEYFFRIFGIGSLHACCELMTIHQGWIHGQIMRNFPLNASTAFWTLETMPYVLYL